MSQIFATMFTVYHSQCFLISQRLIQVCIYHLTTHWKSKRLGHSHLGRTGRGDTVVWAIYCHVQNCIWSALTGQGVRGRSFLIKSGKPVSSRHSLTFGTLATQSGLNEMALIPAYCQGLKPELQRRYPDVMMTWPWTSWLPFWSALTNCYWNASQGHQQWSHSVSSGITTSLLIP